MSVIRDYIGVRSRPTVVRLGDLEESGAEWISSSFALTGDVRAHLEVLRNTLSAPSGCGLFLIGAYGSGKSHFLAYLARSIRSGTFPGNDGGPEVFTVSLLNYRAELKLENILGRELDIDLSLDDRRTAWTQLDERYPQGVLLIIDELSEFLRAKSDPASFNEDVRFLQFLGEWAQSRRFWILAAMQEQIEHTGRLESALYRKIKDRYPIRLLLSTVHLRELISEGVLERKAGAAGAIEELIGRARKALPEARVDFEALAELYPIHPVTLEFLEEVRELFSQARGAVEFVLRRLEGDPARDIEAFLDRPFGEVLTPESIVDHFSDLFEVQPEFLPIAQRLLPWYRRHEGEIFSSAALLETGRRILKLLILVSISPQREGLSVDEASRWLLMRASTISPETNRRIVEKVLRSLAVEGRFVIENEGRYRLDFGDDGVEKLEKLLRRELADIRSAGDEAIWEILRPLLEKGVFALFDLPRERPQRRQVNWHFHSREFTVFFGNGEVAAVDGPGLVIRLPWGDAAPAAEVPTLIPAKIPMSPEIREAAALMRLRRPSLDSRSLGLVEAKLQAARESLGKLLREAYAECSLHGAGPKVSVPAIRLYAKTSLGKWLEEWGIWCLRRLYPEFEKYAPVHGPLPKEAYRSFVRAAASDDPDPLMGDDYLKLIREAYLVPMGLMKRRGFSYEVVSKLEKHDLVAIVLGMVKHGPRPKLIYERLREPVYGLVPDQIHLLLLFLALQGEIDLLKAGRSYRELFESLPLPIHYDRVVQGRGMSAGELQQLEILAEAFKFRIPPQWTPGAQRKMVSRIAQRLDLMAEKLMPLAAKLTHLEGAEPLKERIERFLKLCAAIHRGTTLLEGLEQFLYEIGSPSAFLLEARVLEGWPNRVEALLKELRRLRYLLAQPAVQACRDPELRTRIEALGDPPEIENFELLEEWMAEARTAYEVYVASYREAHASWISEIEKDEIWGWTPPKLCASRHIGLEEELRAFDQHRRRAGELKCRGLGDLEYQPRCSCGFDGETAPVEEELAELRKIRDRITKSLRLFFARSEVRESVATWHEQGLEKSKQTLSYLKGRSEAPMIENVELLDRHLSGMELLKEVDLSEIASRLEKRSWTAEELAEALAGEIRRIRSPRIRLHSMPQEEDRQEILGWCLRQSLQFGLRLPRSFRAEEIEALAGEIDREWIGPEALRKLEELGLGEAVENRVLSFLLEGELDLPEAGELSPLVSAAAELIRPSHPEKPGELATLAARLYGRSRRMAGIGGRKWLQRLEDVAQSPVLSGVPSLISILEAEERRQWLIVDCLGVVLLEQVREALSRALAPWRLEGLKVALVSESTTTDAWLGSLAEAGLSHPLEKINVLDRLIHESSEDFEDLCRLASAQLEIALKKIVPRLDRRKALLLFADHGFRLSPDGRRWIHGGDSTLERLVPVLKLSPGE